jgi:hypothetical protein
MTAESLDAQDRLVLRVLEREARGTGVVLLAIRGERGLVRLSGLTRGALMQSLRKLERLGHLAIEQRTDRLGHELPSRFTIQRAGKR